MLANCVNDTGGLPAHFSRMRKVTHIHQSRQGRRPHHIPAWAELRGLSQAEIAKEIGADKSIVSRWFNGSSPSVPWQEKLAALFHCDTDSLFRHPYEDWMARFLQGREADEIERIRSTLEAAFPRKRA